MTICFDVDGTICEQRPKGDYENAAPFNGVIERIRELAQQGHTILFHTARGTETGIDWREVTESQFERWGVPYHALHFGKPPADLYVDDRAVEVTRWVSGEYRKVA